MIEKKWVNIDGNTLDAEETLPNIDIENDQFEIIVDYRPVGVWHLQDTDTQKSYWEIPGGGVIQSDGRPKLPVDGLYIKVPDQAMNFAVDILEQQFDEVDGTYSILPAQTPRLETEEQFDAQEDPQIYNTDGFFPINIIEVEGSMTVVNTNVFHVLVYPVRYNPVQGKIAVLKKLRFSIHFDEATDGNKPEESEKTYRYSSIEKELVLGIDDESDASQLDSKRFLIITTENLAYSLQVFKGVKTFDYDTEIITVEDIKLQFPSVDDLNAMRNYIAREQNVKAISYVLLGGDLSEVPSALAQNDYTPSRPQFLSDVWLVTKDREKVPFCPIGRIPATTVDEMNSLVDFAAYYDRYYSDKRNSAVFTAYYGTEGYQINKKGIEAKCKSNKNIIDCYDHECSKNDMIAEINKGVGFINYRGHGSDDGWSASNGIKFSDLDKIQVDRNTPIVFSLACNNNNLSANNCAGRGGSGIESPECNRVADYIYYQVYAW
jgi:hypothetical protein